MTTTAVETPEKLVAEYQQTGSPLVFSSIYDYLQANQELIYNTLREILPESMLDRGELSALVDDSTLKSIKSYCSEENSAGFFSHFLATAKQTAEAFKRVLVAGCCSLSDPDKQLRHLVAAYQHEGNAGLYNAIADHSAIVAVADEYRNYMADPESYCVGQAVLHSDYIEMILENALEAAVMELPEGAELPAMYGKYIMAEFEYFIAQSERETVSTTFQQV